MLIVKLRRRGSGFRDVKGRRALLTFCGLKFQTNRSLFSFDLAIALALKFADMTLSVRVTELCWY
jgi:hypothetical protein